MAVFFKNGCNLGLLFYNETDRRCSMTSWDLINDRTIKVADDTEIERKKNVQNSVTMRSVNEKRKLIYPVKRGTIKGSHGHHWCQGIPTNKAQSPKPTNWICVHQTAKPYSLYISIRSTDACLGCIHTPRVSGRVRAVFLWNHMEESDSPMLHLQYIRGC